MNSVIWFCLLLSLLICQASVGFGITAEIPGRCAEVCMTDVESVFFGCADQVDKGCSLKLCNSPANSAKCGLASGMPPMLLTGEDVSFFNFPISKNIDTEIKVRGLKPKVDVYFLVDATGSMDPAIRAFRTSFPQIAASLEGVGDFAYGIGIYRDESELDNGFEHLQGITTDIGSAQDILDSINSTGGADSEEANLVALWRIATGNVAEWRDGAVRLILLFGDAVGHEPTCVDGVTLDRAVVTNALNNASITVQAVGTHFSDFDASTSSQGCAISEDIGRGQTTFITEGTGGSLWSLDGENVPSVLATFGEALTTQAKVIDLAETSCSFGVTLKFDPPLPARMGPFEKIGAKMRLRRRVCSRSAPFKCSISFRSGNSVSEPLNMSFAPSGCPS